jgi:hypothetical protein
MKDPAFLFYSGDFIAGVSEMTMEERGQYITLLCFQHGKGHLSLEFIKRAIPGISEYVLAKFKTDSEGLYFNERLEFEAEKRKNYSESRRNNRKKKDMLNISETYDKHMENENENENINEDIDVIDKVSNKVDKPKNKKKSIVKRTELAKGLTDEQFIDEMAKKGLHPCVKYDSPFVLLSLNHWKQLKDRFPVEGLLVEMVKVYNNWKMKNGGVRRSVNDFASVQEGWVVENAMKILNAKNSFTYDKMRKQQLLADEFKQSNQSGSTQFFNPPPPPQLTNEQ